jgi:hypothetical protein
MISGVTLGFAKCLHDKIESAYDCIPQVIKKNDSIGFNVDGQEAGRVEQISTRDIRSTFYAPDKQSLLPVFT